MIGVSFIFSFLAGLAALGAAEEMGQSKVLLFSLVIGLWGTVISLTKDFKDYEGDSQAGVKNVLTIFGREKARIKQNISWPN